MKKLGLIAATAAVLALAGCNNGAQEVVNVTKVTSNNYYDVEGSYNTTITYKKGGKDVTENFNLTSSDKTLARITWVDDAATDSNAKSYGVYITGLSYPYSEYVLDDKNNKKYDDDGEPVTVTKTDTDGTLSLTITKIGDSYFVNDITAKEPEETPRTPVSAKFAGNETYTLISEEVELEDDEVTFVYTRTWTKNNKTYKADVNFTLTKL